MGSYQGTPPPTLPPTNTAQVCLVTLDGVNILDDPPLDGSAHSSSIESSIPHKILKGITS
jgi:hypothetical protein